MSQLFQLATRSGSPIAVDSGAGVVNGYAEGLPFVGNSLAVDTAGAIAGYQMGIPFTAAGRIAVSSAPVARYNDGAMPLDAAGRIAMDGGAVTNYSAGIPYTASGAIAATGLSAAWTPAKLFEAGQAGGFYDISVLGSLFQDAAGTIPVTADGQIVKRINDLSGNGNHMTSVNGAPYRAGAGKPYLEFDGTDRTFVTAAMHACANCAIAVYWDYGHIYWPSWMTASAGGGWSKHIEQDVTNPMLVISAPPGPDVLPTASRVWVNGNKKNDLIPNRVPCTIFVDGFEHADPLTSTSPMLIGNEYLGTQYPHGKLFAWIMNGNSVAQVLSDVDRQQLIDWLDSKLTPLNLGPELFTGFTTVTPPWTGAGVGPWSIDGSQVADTRSSDGATIVYGGPAYQILSDVSFISPSPPLDFQTYAYIFSGADAIRQFHLGKNKVIRAPADSANFIYAADAGKAITIRSISVKQIIDAYHYFMIHVGQEIAGGDLLIGYDEGIYGSKTTTADDIPNSFISRFSTDFLQEIVTLDNRDNVQARVRFNSSSGPVDQINVYVGPVEDPLSLYLFNWDTATLSYKTTSSVLTAKLQAALNADLTVAILKPV